MSTMTAASGTTKGMTKDERFVIFASSLGTVFEWYDFYLYGSLASIIGAQFFSAYPPATRDIFALLAFAAGFLVRPFGAIVFGRVGDHRRTQIHLPRHHPDHGPVDLHRRPAAQRRHHRYRRADHPDRSAPAAGPRARRRVRRSRDLRGRACAARQDAATTPSFIQTTATLGLFLSLLVILFTRTILGEADFAAWGWRIPFLLSVVLLGVSVVIRLKLNESRSSRR